jgi:hypothetical protein
LSWDGDEPILALYFDAVSDLNPRRSRSACRDIPSDRSLNQAGR